MGEIDTESGWVEKGGRKARLLLGLPRAAGTWVGLEDVLTFGV
jgi:hypothetical protein